MILLLLYITENQCSIVLYNPQSSLLKENLKLLLLANNLKDLSLLRHCEQSLHSFRKFWQPSQNFRGPFGVRSSSRHSDRCTLALKRSLTWLLEVWERRRTTRGCVFRHLNDFDSSNLRCNFFKNQLFTTSKHIIYLL